jgi:hypothetical protein
MNKDDLKLEPQEAPEKNTDAAFVQVGADGKPKMPDENAQSKTDNQPPKEGTLADR